ncbi:MAG: DUF692 domain-containing protein [Planctomycetes bacterium]|nr:DUF692 domain-containing protein [Planctomycetota bacterium]
MTPPLLGLNVAPDAVFLSRTRRMLEEEADFLEITPETLWAAGCAPGPHWDDMVALVAKSALPVVGHGVGLSLGTPGIDARAERWLAAIRRDHAAFHFLWYSEHFGFAGADNAWAALPLPLPPTDEAVQSVAARLRRLRDIVPTVAFENNVGYATLGAPSSEPVFINAICSAAECGLLLDLHNVHVQCDNLGVPTDAYLAALDLSNVIEIHVSGGSISDPRWLASGRTMRLDSHDGPVPPEVWTSLAWALPRCPNLRGVVLERIDGSLGEADIPAHEADVRRLREMLC